MITVTPATSGSSVNAGRPPCSAMFMLEAAAIRLGGNECCWINLGWLASRSQKKTWQGGSDIEGQPIRWQGNSWRLRLLEFGDIAGGRHTGAVVVAVIRIGLCPDRRAGRSTLWLRHGCLACRCQRGSSWLYYFAAPLRFAAGAALPLLRAPILLSSQARQIQTRVRVVRYSPSCPATPTTAADNSSGNLVRGAWASRHCFNRQPTSCNSLLFAPSS